jgi:outer membrane protein assembly factor BamB
MMLCTDDVLFFEAQTRQHVVALSAKDGRLLWERPKSRNDPTLLFLDGQLITSHETTDTLALDPLTGAVQKSLGFRKVNCTRMTATPDSLFCRGEGLGRYDRNDGQYRIDGSARPGCNDGAIPANGLLYVGPWCCDCNLSLIGTVALCSAGDFNFGHVADAKGHLETGDGDTQQVRPLEVTPLDWPTYRANNQRGAASRASVPADVQEAWRYAPDQPCRMTPATSGGRFLFFGRDDGKVLCLETETGELSWEFITGGPIRQPPTIWEGRAFVGSGDGYVYCLEAATGRLLWRFRAAPVERKIMVYGSLCSTWPVNSDVLAHEGVAYAAAGIIDRDGTYVCALDARTGEVVWQNNTSGHLDKDLRKGVSAQGGLAVARGRLWLAAGNQVSPAAFDLKTGECATWLTPRGRPGAPRGAEIGVWMDDHVVHGGRLLYSDTGKVVNPGQFSFVPLDEDGNVRYPAMMPIQRSSIPPAWDEKTLVALTQRYNQLVCWDNDLLLEALEVRREEERLRQEAMRRNPDPSQRRRKMWATNPLLDSLFRHTGRWGPVDRDTLGVVLAANGVVTVSGPPPRSGEEREGQWTVLAWGRDDGKAIWGRALPGEPLANGLIIDREGRIIVALKNGQICCFKAK